MEDLRAAEVHLYAISEPRGGSEEEEEEEEGEEEEPWMVRVAEFSPDALRRSSRPQDAAYIVPLST